MELVMNKANRQIDQKTKLWHEAKEVLKENHLGTSTKPAPQLYPHQWSWDSAFIAIGLTHIDLELALVELETLFKAQWKDGRVPHIVFNPEHKDYYPGPDEWCCTEVTDQAPNEPLTSGLIQPPVHAIAALRVWKKAQLNGVDITKRMKALYTKLLEWHRYLATKRDPEGMGLISIYHPWSSGTDNSPRWDDVLKGIEPGEMPPVRRRDTKHVHDASQRPTDEEYRKYMWLVELLKQKKYDDEAIHDDYPFVIKDALMSGIFAWANHDLYELGNALEADPKELEELKQYEKRTVDGVMKYSWDKVYQLTLDLDLNNDCSKIEVSTSAGLAVLLLPECDDHTLKTAVRRLTGKDFAGHGSFKFAAIPSATPYTDGYREKCYWRGPTWPVIDWLYSEALKKHGFKKDAEILRKENLKQLEQDDAKFGEYFDLMTGEPLGSLNQSWTAAVAIDWLEQH